MPCVAQPLRKLKRGIGAMRFLPCIPKYVYALWVSRRLIVRICLFDRVVDVTKLREDLILKLERERSDQVVRLRAKQKQVGFCKASSLLSVYAKHCSKQLYLYSYSNCGRGYRNGVDQ